MKFDLIETPLRPHVGILIILNPLTVPSKIQTHIAGVHEGRKDFHCDLCEKAFADRSNLKRHVSSYHEGEKFNCEICKKGFGI